MKLAHLLKNKFFSNHQNPKLNPQCSEFEVNNWIISEFILNKLVPKIGIHPFPLPELHLMTAATCYLQPEQIFEWGTNVGKSARIFYEITKFFKIPALIHSIDLPDDVSHVEHPNTKRGYLVKNCKNVFLHQGDGATISQQIYSQNPNARTLVFVDGDHSYGSVKNELSQIRKEMPNAWILLHDTFYQTEQSKYNVGPHQAIKEFLIEAQGEYKFKFVDLGLPGMTLLYKQ